MMWRKSAVQCVRRVPVIARRSRRTASHRAPRRIERIAFIVPKQHMDVLHRHLITGLVLVFHTPRAAS